MKILGIDPGYDRVGWAVLDSSSQSQYQLLEYGCIQTNKNERLLQRYSQISTTLKDILTTHQPHFTSMESVFFSKNQRTAMRVSEARGVIIAGILPFTPALVEYTPNQVKLAVTGYGSADKAAVAKMLRLQLRFNDENLLDDTIDAIAIAFTHVLLRNDPV